MGSSWCDPAVGMHLILTKATVFHKTMTRHSQAGKFYNLYTVFLKSFMAVAELRSDSHNSLAVQPNNHSAVIHTCGGGGLSLYLALFA